MALSTQPYKGARDFYPEDKRQQKYIFSTIRNVVERFGYEEYDAPILEPLDIYLAKTGEEIVNEQTYVFEDRGGRKVVIRPEMTPTVSRMVAGKRQELAYPVRWYSIPNLWRYERPQRGRLREHWQLNVDIFGVASVAAEAEVINVADDIFQAFKASRDMYEIRINDRRLVNHLFSEVLKLSPDQAHAVSKLIDRMHKTEHSKFIKDIDNALTPEQKAAGATEALLNFLAVKNLADLKLADPQVTNELNELFSLLKAQGVANAVFDPTIMRGFDYYTGIVFEVFDLHPDNNRAMMGGGRYDGLVGMFGVEPVPTVGFGLGDVTLANFLELHHLMPPLPHESQLVVILAGNVTEPVQSLLKELRNAGLNLAVDYSGRKIGDQIKSAAKKQIAYALIVGDQELNESKYNLKNLATGEEEKLSLEQILGKLKA